MTLGLGYYAIFKGSEVCTGADRKVAGIWNVQRKVNVRQAFANTSLSYANDTFVRVERRFGEYLHRWKNEYTDVCEATRIRGEQSEEIMEFKLRCLKSHLRNADALIRVFGRADKITVKKAIQVVASLPGQNNCNDVEALQSRIQLPNDEQTKKRIAAIREKLAEVEAFEKTGKYKEGLELSRNLKLEATAIVYPPIQAEALYRFGKLLAQTGEYKKAETAFYEALQAAGECRDSLFAAKIMIKNVSVVSYDQARYKEGLMVSRDAEVMLRIAGGNESIQAELSNTVGSVYWRCAEYNKALRHFRKTLELKKKTLGPQHPDVALALNNIGSIFSKIGDSGKALEYFQQSLQIYEMTIGSKHPDVSWPLYNIGNILKKNGDYRGSLENHQRALNIYQAAVGPEHPGVGESLLAIGDLLIRQGRTKQAHKYLERELSICEKNTCDPNPHGVALFGVSHALVSKNGDVQLAIKLTKKALQLFGKTPNRFKKELQEAHAWLTKHQSTKDPKQRRLSKSPIPK